MSRRVLLLLVLTAVVVTLQAQHVHELLTRGMGPLFGLRIERGELVAGPLYRGTAASRFAAAGLREGDVIEAAYTGNGIGGPVRGLGLFLDVRRSTSAASPMRLIVRRPSVGDRRLHIDVPMPSSRPAGILALNLAWTILLPGAALIAALLLGVLKPDDRRAFIGSLLFIAFAGAFGADPWLLSGEVRTLALAVKVLCAFGVDALFLWFFLIFPTPSIIDRRVPWLKVVALAIMSAGAAVSFTRQAVELSSFATLERVRAWLPEPLTGRFFSAAALSFIFIGLLSLTLNTLRKQSRDDRRRMLIILGGTLTSLLPFTAIAAYFSVTEQPPPPWVLVILGTLIAVFPISFVYAVVRHRVLGIRLMLRRGAQHALISAGFRLLLGVVVFLLFWFVIGPLIWPVGQGTVTNGLVAAGAALAAARLLRTVRSRVMPAIDRRFFRDAYDARRVLTDLSHSARELALEPDRLLAHLVDSVSATLYPRRTAVLTRALDPATDAASGPFRCVALRSDEGQPVDPAMIEIPENGLIASRVAPTDLGPSGPVDLFLDEPRSWAHALVSNREHASERASIEALGAQLVVPLVAGQRLLGLLLLGEKRSEEPYSRDDKELLATVAEQTALALDYGQLARRSAREESLRKEVEIARNVQARLFPQSLPPIPALDYAGACRPAREIGGDSYDFIALGHGRLGLAVGDISGKGVAAALLMASLQALLRSHAPLPGRDLKDLVGDINRLLAASIPDNRFATFFYGVFDSDRGTFTYVNAGHNPPMLLRAGAAAATRLEPTGVMLGMFADASFEQATVALDPGDLLVVYSDGVCDALNLAGQDYGDVRLETFVRAHAALPASGLMDRILDDVTAFSQGVAPFDDITLVVAKVNCDEAQRVGTVDSQEGTSSGPPAVPMALPGPAHRLLSIT